VTPFPSNSTLLPANATSFADTTPVPGVRCYTVLVLGGNPPGSINDGNGDLICAWRGLANGVAPADFTARLDQGQNATLSWAPGSTPNGAILFVASGGGTLQIAVGPGQNSIPHNTGGAFTCYILLVSSGITDALCPFPGASTLVGGTAAGASVVDGATRLREQLLGR